MTLKVLDLFSGIGGFSLGLERAGMETVAFCEIDEFCQSVLAMNFPNKKIFTDIKKLTKEEINELGTIDIVCGGFPCQPFSIAGQKKGTEDDRDLWPEMFRIIQEARPTWIIGENVTNFVNMAFTRTKVDLESIGYSVQPFIIPACAVGARHRRDRTWIIAHLNSDRLWEQSKSECERSSEGIGQCDGEKEFTSNLNGNGFNGQTNATSEKNYKRIWQSNGWAEAATDFGYWWANQSGMGRTIYGFSNGLDKYRKQRIKALGNAVVPLIPEVIGRAIIQSQKECL